MTKCVVTDIDGTIFELTRVTTYSHWEQQVQASPPKPILPMRDLIQALGMGGLRVIYATARRETLREFTARELAKYGFPTGFGIYMRPNDVNLAQDVLKLRYLKTIQSLNWQPVAWFEDDPDTIAALQSQGIFAIKC